MLALLRQIIASHTDGESIEWLGDGLFDIRVRRFGLPIGNLTSQFLSNVYLSPLDHFVKHELRVKGYVRYMDDFLLFGDDRLRLRARGRAVIEKLGELRLKMHPDKYRLRPTRIGVDFVGFAVFADGRIHLRRASVRRFERRYRRQRWQVEHQGADVDDLMKSVRSWIAHAQHAKSLNLRRSVLGHTSCGRSRGSAAVSSAPFFEVDTKRGCERRGGFVTSIAREFETRDRAMQGLLIAVA